MKKYRKIVMLSVLISAIFLLTGCSKNKDEELKTKVISELDYLNMKTVEMLNNLNNISFENYEIISEQIKLSDEEQKQQSQSGGESQGSNQGNSGQSENSQGSEQGGSGGSSDTKEPGEKQEGESKDAVNTTTMVGDSELDKDKNDIDWSFIKKEVELLNESWSVIVLDLYSLNVKNNTILNFSDKLNTSMIAIKNEDKAKSLATLADLYSSIPEFLKEIGAEENMQKIRQTQSHVINAYVVADDMENATIKDHVTQALNVYSEVMSNIDYTKNKTEKTNKVYVLLNELQNSINEKDSDIFYVKYKNFMKEIQSI